MVSSRIEPLAASSLPAGGTMSVSRSLILAWTESSPAVEGHQRLGHRAEGPTLAGCAVALHGQEVRADDHVLGGHGHRTAVGRLQDVVGRQHQDPGLGLRLRAQRQVHGHLVTVEVGVERRTDQRVDLDGLALDQLRLESLDAQAGAGSARGSAAPDARR